MKPLTGDELAAIDAAVVLGNRIPKITTLRLVAEVCRLTEENASYADELLTCDREEWRVRAESAEAEVERTLAWARESEADLSALRERVAEALNLIEAGIEDHRTGIRHGGAAALHEARDVLAKGAAS